MKTLIAVVLASLLSLHAFAESTRVRLVTNSGNIVIELNGEKAPVTVDNFLRYVKENHYAGTIFHRVVKGFVAQGGGFDVKLWPRETHDPIINEAKNGLHNSQYTIAMARETAPHTATDQFYFNLVDNSFLDFPGRDGWGYCVFGKVIEGTEVLDKIGVVPTGVKDGMEDVPLDSIIIQSAEIVK
jgi:peptidyl-prolyl cis-trans isomerase B (cyclophilin B)